LLTVRYDRSDTRLQKLDSPDLPYTALILASAGLLRLSLHDRITSYISPPVSYPAIGQGFLGAEFRSADTKVKAMISKLEVWKDGWAVRAERALLEVLEGGCAVPVGIWSSWSGDNIASESLVSTSPGGSQLSLKSVMTSPDGSGEITVETMGIVTSVEEALELGKQAATSLLEKGGRAIIVDLRAEIDRAAAAQNEVVAA
jgi:hydroxymethylbilane synthase